MEGGSEKRGDSADQFEHQGQHDRLIAERSQQPDRALSTGHRED